MATSPLTPAGLLGAFLIAVFIAATGSTGATPAAASQTPLAISATDAPGRPLVVLPAAAPPQRFDIVYTAHDGRPRHATVLLPHGYRADDAAPLPLVISPHGRGVDGALNARLWGTLPTIGNFAVVNPDGEGRRLKLHSWGAPGQIRDLARMPAIVESALPWVHIDRTRIYSVGGSMGGQETLLLVARYPRLLAGAVAVDSVADFARQYENFTLLDCNGLCRARWGNFGLDMQRLARREFGGTPSTAPAAYAERSPLTYAAAIAASCVPLQIWWTRVDQIVRQSNLQSGAMFRAIVRRNAGAAVDAYIGGWIHTHALNYRARLPMMLAGLGLMPESYIVPHRGLTHERPSSMACSKG
jgi:pimeloyl-ACP methyl ester carboxylesterase